MGDVTKVDRSTWFMMLNCFIYIQPFHLDCFVRTSPISALAFSSLGHTAAAAAYTSGHCSLISSDPLHIASFLSNFDLPFNLAPDHSSYQRTQVLALSTRDACGQQDQTAFHHSCVTAACSNTMPSSLHLAIEAATVIVVPLEFSGKDRLSHEAFSSLKLQETQAV